MKAFLMRLIGGFIVLTLIILFAHPYTWPALTPIVFGVLEVAIDKLTAGLKRTQVAYFGIFLNTAFLLLLYQIIFFTVNAFSEGAWWGYLLALILAFGVYHDYFIWNKKPEPTANESVKILYVIHPNQGTGAGDIARPFCVGDHDKYVTGCCEILPVESWTLLGDYVGDFENKVLKGQYGLIVVVHILSSQVAGFEA